MKKRLRFAILERDGFCCLYCGARAPEAILHVDHVIPFIDGGEAVSSNLVTSCQSCNMGKVDKLIKTLPPQIIEALGKPVHVGRWRPRPLKKPVISEKYGDLRAARQRRGLGVKAAAKIHGVSLGTFWNWENGLHAPQGRYLEPLLAKWPELRMPGDNTPKMSSLA